MITHLRSYYLLANCHTMFLATTIIIALLTFAWLTWRDFEFGIAFFIFLLPTYLLRFSLGPLPTTVLELLFVILLIRWLYEKKSIKNISSSLGAQRKSPFFWPGTLLLAWGDNFYPLCFRNIACTWNLESLFY